MLNEQHYYHPQQLKEFLQEKVSHLFYGLEVSINCNVSLYVYSTQTHLKQTLIEDCNEHYHFTQFHGCKQT